MTTTTALLPMADFCGTQLARLAIGGNPFRGHSHISPELNQEMRDYHSVENVVQTLQRAEECGINAMQSRADDIVYQMLDAYRLAGGTMHWIAQTASENPDLFANIRDIAARDAWGIYWHGSMTDRLWKAGQIDKAEDYLKAMRDEGVKVGIACHMPEVLRYIEDAGWDLDFYMVCFYNIAKIERDSAIVTGKVVEEPFDDPDRDIACQFHPRHRQTLHRLQDPGGLTQMRFRGGRPPSLPVRLRQHQGRRHRQRWHVPEAHRPDHHEHSAGAGSPGGVRPGCR